MPGTATRCDDGALHIMRSCTPGIWPALVRTNKYSKDRARRNEASSSESNTPCAPFPALWREISKSYSTRTILCESNVSRDAYVRVHHQGIIVRGPPATPRINSRRRNREQSSAADAMRPISSGHTSRATVRLQRASKRGDPAFSPQSARESREK